MKKVISAIFFKKESLNVGFITIIILMLGNFKAQAQTYLPLNDARDKLSLEIKSLTHTLEDDAAKPLTNAYLDGKTKLHYYADAFEALSDDSAIVEVVIKNSLKKIQQKPLRYHVDGEEGDKVHPIDPSIETQLTQLLSK